MAEQEAEQAYDFLLSWLHKNQLEWVAEQIQDEVALGKIKSQRITVEKESGAQLMESLPVFGRSVGNTSSRSITRSSAEFLARVDYTPFEKFEIAAGAIEAVVLGAVQIEDTLLQHTSSSSINFIPGETGESRHSIDVPALAVRRTAVTRLAEYLRALRDDVHDAH